MTLKNFVDAVAVITGGASGIGLATAEAFYARGAHVVLADINSRGLEQAVPQVRESNPSSTAQVQAVVTDVTDDSQVQALMRRVRERSGRIDLVVTSAGLGSGGPIDFFTGEQMQTLMNVNFMGTYHSVRAALPAMRQQQSGHFVFLSSATGKLGVPLLTAYSATKWAIRGFSAALRAELYGTGIGVTTVYPAWVDTPMLRQEVAMRTIEMEVLLTPEQVASEILQAVQENRTDLTLAPNQDVAYLLQVVKEDQDKAEELVGASFQERLQQLLAQQALTANN
jgi:NAD(P)-dependent dehydrogenase (short-subunit alcohol dehydrogenase family)